MHWALLITGTYCNRFSAGSPRWAKIKLRSTNDKIALDEYYKRRKKEIENQDNQEQFNQEIKSFQLKQQLEKTEFELIKSTEKEKTELSSKEADLLMLLYSSLNQTLERETILNKVWGDEGDYVGRTLDVFISKLRKKLEQDPEIKIVNVRGVGYKMVI